MTEIVGRYQVRHSCRPELHEMLEEVGIIKYGWVVQCGICQQTWIIMPYRPFLRRTIKAFSENGWWIRETRRQARRRTSQIDREVAKAFEGMPTARHE